MYKSKIGLEVHLQLLTKKKAFSFARFSNNALVNSRVSSIDLGYPGTLPILEKEFIILGLKVALLLNMKISNILAFDRKHYLYPDLPKGFQITQHFTPLGTNGFVILKNKKRINIWNIHLEEDTAKRIYSEKHVLIDYNRCGKPLVEIVTAPDFSSEKEVIDFLNWLQSEMINASLTRGVLAEGSLRCDINFSMYNEKSKFSTKRVEIKNLNSLKSITDAILYEKKLHKEAIDKKKPTFFTTKSFNEATRKTWTMRVKNEVKEYFYLPEPNLLPMNIKDEWILEAKDSLPISIVFLEKQLLEDYQISKEVVKSIISNRHLLQLLKQSINSKWNKNKEIIKTVANWLSKIPSTLLLKYSKEDNITTQLNVNDLLILYNSIKANKIDSSCVKEMIHKWLLKENIVEQINEQKTKIYLDDEKIIELIQIIIEENKRFINTNLQKRRQRVEKMLMGLMMKKTKGQVKPQIVMKIIKQKLDNFN